MAVVALLAVILLLNAPGGAGRIAGAFLAGAGTVLAAMALRRRRLPRVTPALALAFAAVVAVVAGWPVQRQYLDDRYARGGLPEPIEPSYLALRDVKGAHIAVGGFIGNYPLYGRRPENTVDFPVIPESHGDFRRIENCPDWVAALESGDYDYVVTAPDEAGELPPEEAWTRADPRARQVLREGHNTVFRLEGRAPRVRARGRLAARARGACARAP